MQRKKIDGSEKSTVKLKPAFGRMLTDDPDDAPELLDGFFERAEFRIGGRIIRPGRPPLGLQPKNAVTLRLDADVLASYRALGTGWQTRLNADLRKVRKLKPLPRPKAPAPRAKTG